MMQGVEPCSEGEYSVADRGQCESGGTLFSTKDNMLNNIIIDVVLGSVHS